MKDDFQIIWTKCSVPAACESSCTSAPSSRLSDVGVLTRCSLCTLAFNSGWISKDGQLRFPDVLFSVLHCRVLQGKEKSWPNYLWLKLPDTDTSWLSAPFSLLYKYIWKTLEMIPGNLESCKYEASDRCGGKIDREAKTTLITIWPSCNEMLRSYSCQAALESGNRLRWRKHVHCSMLSRRGKETVYVGRSTSIQRKLPIYSVISWISSTAGRPWNSSGA